MRAMNVVDRVSTRKGAGHLEEAVLLQGKAWSIRHMEDGSVFKEERFAKEEPARRRWAEIQKAYSGA